jgi:SNF2 family DNA or RNA helicase
MLTGTPVQNHLGELWNLFQFVNPGLLGSYEDFSRRFIGPIEVAKDKERQQQLDRIVHPFMLRRTKEKVLDELPEKTEIYQTVDLSPEEMAVYEIIRENAQQMLEAENSEKVSINALAEITRLRQASCAAQLVEKNWKGKCSKIEALIEALEPIIESGDAALVFSQFTSFLAIVQKELDKAGIPYLYIDGTVSVKERQKLVEKFQNGECPVFIISLKAGGLGLNLTRANYVFHLDPWWNPAIEQQATDRAHRMGQHNAVTVYHFLSSGTIEEKIKRLHEQKRDLAENILEGTDMSGKITGKELLEMIK